jgi:hypothetical protein
MRSKGTSRKGRKKTDKRKNEIMKDRRRGKRKGKTDRRETSVNKKGK